MYRLMFEVHSPEKLRQVWGKDWSQQAEHASSEWDGISVRRRKPSLKHTVDLDFCSVLSDNR